MEKLIILILTLVAVVSCGFDITKVTPEFLDTKRGYARKYEFYKVKAEQCGDPDFATRDTGVRVPISEMNGHICFPTNQAQDMYAHYLKYLRDKQNCNNFEKDMRQ